MYIASEVEVARNRNLENETETNKLNKYAKRICYQYYFAFKLGKIYRYMLYIFFFKLKIQIKVIENIFVQFSKQNKQYQAFVSELSHVFFLV